MSHHAAQMRELRADTTLRILQNRVKHKLSGFSKYAACTRRGTACGGGRQILIDYPQGGACVGGAVICGGSTYGRGWRYVIIVGGSQRAVLRDGEE